MQETLHVAQMYNLLFCNFFLFLDKFVISMLLRQNPNLHYILLRGKLDSHLLRRKEPL